jgi:hypothetical protein
MHKTPYVFPIVGGRKVEHLKQNIQALDISLSPEQIKRIDDANPIDFGFPYTVIVRTTIQLPDTTVAELVNRAIIQKRRSLDEASCSILTTVSPHRL